MKAPIFNYNTLSTKLSRETRTLFVTFNKPENNNAIDFELLFELESLLAWATGHVEIHSIFIDSSLSFLSSGINRQWLKAADSSRVKKLMRKLKIINQAINHLPQTIVMDLGDGASNIAAELFLSADIRIGSDRAQIIFDHGSIGLTPSAGGISLLKELVTTARASHWLKLGQAVSTEELIQSGLLFKTYKKENRAKLIHEILLNLHLQAPVARIQTKMGLFETFRENLNNNLTFDQKTFNAAAVSEDWRNNGDKNSENDKNMKAKSFKTAIKLSLIQGGKTRDPEASH